MTGGLLLQSQYNDQEEKKCMISKHFQYQKKSLDVLNALLDICIYQLK